MRLFTLDSTEFCTYISHIPYKPFPLMQPVHAERRLRREHFGRPATALRRLRCRADAAAAGSAAPEMSQRRPLTGPACYSRPPAAPPACHLHQDKLEYRSRPSEPYCGRKSQDVPCTSNPHAQSGPTDIDQQQRKFQDGGGGSTDQFDRCKSDSTQPIFLGSALQGHKAGPIKAPRGDKTLSFGVRPR